MYESNRTMWWMLLVILVATTAFAVYKMIVDKEIPYIQFTIVAALSGAILRQLPLFLKYKTLNIIPAAIAVVLFVIGVITEIK